MLLVVIRGEIPRPHGSGLGSLFGVVRGYSVIRGEIPRPHGSGLEGVCCNRVGESSAGRSRGLIEAGRPGAGCARRGGVIRGEIPRPHGSFVPKWM